MIHIRNILRLLLIVRVINTQGGLFYLKKIFPKTLFIFSPFIIKPKNKTVGEILRNILYRLGPAFIKFGQVLSTREDLISKEVALELAQLQDRLPPVQKNYIVQAFRKNFETTASNIFKEFNYETVASASISEVFKAKTFDGNDVAVKILKPGIRKQFQKDIEFFKWLCFLIEKFFISSKRLKLIEVIETFEELIKFELDLKLEAAAASKMKSVHINDNNIYIPEVYWNLTTEEILTLEWVNGVKINEVAVLSKKGFNLQKISAELIRIFFKQAFDYGFFHADLHAGNILIDKKGKIVLIDFGITGWLDNETRIYIAEILYGFLKKDYEYVAKVHFEAGYVSKKNSFFAFSQACRAIGEPIVGQPVNQISIAKLLAQLFKTTKDFDMETQPQLLLLQKTMVMVEGLGTKLCLSINMWEVIQPDIENWAKRNLAFDAKIINKLKKVNNDFNDIIEYFKLKNNFLLTINKKPQRLSYFNKYMSGFNLIILILIIYLLAA